MLNEKGLLKFIYYAGLLKHIRRKGWVEKVRIADAESVAEHSYRVALISAVFARLRGADIGKATLMALLHDLPESITGDRTPEECKGDERSAFFNVISGLDEDIKSELLFLWEEYLDGKSIEANIVRQADKLEMAVQALEYAKSGYPKRLLREFLKSAEKSLFDGDFKRLMEAICYEFDKD